ncbi:MAG: BamA/TamA family outer membrane protein [Candidatus Zixiibacteriota bacterium]|nr:MAG: BamA/TamA family outer membrane protein [candidate division Zixibacteria bacterium]
MRLALLAVITGLVSFVASGEATPNDRATLRWIRSKPAIDSIVVQGNEHFSDGDIKSLIYSRTRNLWRRIRGDRRYRIQRETHNRDTLEVKYLYLSNGFLDVEVDETFEVLGKDSTAALVRIEINEGPRYRYGPVDVRGNVSSRLLHRCREIARRFKAEKPINMFALQHAVFDMKTHMANNGYPYAQIVWARDTAASPQQTPVVFVITPDSLVHFGAVAVEGAEQFPQSVARRELKIKPGAVYRRDDIIKSQRRLFESGYYSTISLKMSNDTDDRLNPDFVLRVRERKPKYLGFRTGAGQSEVRDLLWDVSAGFGQRNLFGSRRYELLADYSFSLGTDSRLITHRYRLRYTEPWFLGLRMPLTLTFEIQPRLKDPTNDFDKRSWLASASTRKAFGEKVLTALGIQYEFVKISGVPEDQVEWLKRSTDNTARRKLFAAFRRDSRDNLFIPRRGVVADLSVDYYGGFLGGDENFYKLEASWSRYEVVWPGWIMATRVRGSWSDAFGESAEVPLDEVIYLGGANTLRGFEENSLGRYTEDGALVGARYTLVFNQEFRWKTVQVFNEIPILNNLMRTLPLWQSIFMDIGNGFRRREEISWDAFAYSFGTGVQIVTPAGPVRIDYARRIRSRNFNSAERWHFTILYAF